MHVRNVQMVEQLAKTRPDIREPEQVDLFRLLVSIVLREYPE